MDKKIKIFIVSISCILLVALVICIVLLVVPKATEEVPTTDNQDIASTEPMLWGDSEIKHDAPILYKLIMKDVASGEVSSWTVVYEDNYAIQYDKAPNGKLLATPYTLNAQVYTEIKAELDKIADIKSVTDLCTSGNIYTIECPQEQKNYQTCGNCSNEVALCYVKIKNIIRKA